MRTTPVTSTTPMTRQHPDPFQQGASPRDAGHTWWLSRLFPVRMARGKGRGGVGPEQRPSSKQQNPIENRSDVIGLPRSARSAVRFLHCLSPCWPRNNAYAHNPPTCASVTPTGGPQSNSAPFRLSGSGRREPSEATNTPRTCWPGHAAVVDQPADMLRTVPSVTSKL